MPRANRAFTLTHNASSLGIVLMVDALGLVTTLLIGGVLADRYARRLLMIGSDLGRAVVIGGLAAVDATGHLGFGVLIAFVAFHGLGSGLFQPAFGGILPLLVEEPSLGSANALIGVSRQAAFVIGPAIAGGIYGAAGSSAIFAADAASFLVSASFLAPARPRTYEQAPVEGVRRELQEFRQSVRDDFGSVTGEVGRTLIEEPIIEPPGEPPPSERGRNGA